MMNFFMAEVARGWRAEGIALLEKSVNFAFKMKNDEFFIANGESCIKDDGFCI